MKYFEAQAREAERREFFDTGIRESGLLGRFRDASFETFNAVTTEQRNAAVECAAFAGGATFGRWETLTMIGPPGVGKTHLGAAMVRQTIVGGSRAKYTTCRDLIRALRATWRRDSPQSEDDVINGFAYTGLLVVDEVGTGMGTEAEVTQLLDVLDRRYQVGGPTAFATNLQLPELRGVIGDRAFDRLRERSRLVPMNWPSHRGSA
ncbi:ATP-binding protein [Hydrogenophaga taeniospiralis]|uniref:ATP-binding protein n=1 Tax=Hydrogenophaga taeniospiralis TaxID=65656 RepID=UPI001CF9690B|nr:ATP-binding protein [Hydrogenophaga taeniospiralis]MCB4365740.1 ATP-binding protein [Hydrogenophaga taeniospiralis]